MTTVDRRSFLTLAGSAFGAAAMPDWLARAFAPQDPASDWRRKQLRGAIDLAKGHGKPLLVLVVPKVEEAAKGNERGLWFGAWLNHGGASALHEVGTCVLACATVDEVVQAAGCEPIAGQPWMLVVDAGAIGAARGEEKTPKPKVTPIVLDLDSPYLPYAHDSAEAYEAARTRHVESGMEKLTKELATALHRHGANLAVLAERADAALTTGQRDELRRWIAGERDGGTLLAARATAVVRRAMTTLPDDQRAALAAALTAAITEVVVKQRIAGSRWQLPGGCGHKYEDETEAEKRAGTMVACGMGIVNKHCERFLSFYTVGS